MARTIAITGGAGFVGLALAEVLLARGTEVHLLDIAPPDPALREHPALHGHLFHPADIMDQAALAALLRAIAPDMVIHGAAVTPNDAMSRAAPVRIVDINVGGTVRALAATAEAGARRFMLLSSVSVYGGAGPWPSDSLRETDPVRPTALYGDSKRAAEVIAARVAPGLGLDLVTLRLAALYGPWEVPRHLRPDLSPHGQILALAREGRAARLAHGMESDWLYSRDAAQMIAAVADRFDAAAGGCFNIGAGTRSTLSDWAAAMELPRPLIDPESPDIAARMAQDRPPMDITAISGLTGLDGTRPLAEAAADHRAWLAGL